MVSLERLYVMNQIHLRSFYANETKTFTIWVPKTFEFWTKIKVSRCKYPEEGPDCSEISPGTSDPRPPRTWVLPNSNYSKSSFRVQQLHRRQTACLNFMIHALHSYNISEPSLRLLSQRLLIRKTALSRFPPLSGYGVLSWNSDVWVGFYGNLICFGSCYRWIFKN